MAPVVAFRRLNCSSSCQQDPTFLRGLVLASIVPQRLTISDLASAGSVTATDGQQLPVKAQSGGMV